MGIKGLNKLINYLIPSAISQKHISEFKGSKIAIDSEILIHKYRTVDQKNSHIFGFINNVTWYLENGIIPVYVFDGSPNIAKQTNIISKRSIYKDQITQKIEELEIKVVEQLDNNEKDGELDPEINDTLDQLFKIQKKISFMTVNKNHRNECKYLLKLLGIPFIVADEDAEAFCITLYRKGIVDFIYTEDTDIIPYFIASIEINSDITNKNQPVLKVLRKSHINSMVNVININEIFEAFNLTPREFIDMCILCGCDFCTNIPKITPIKAYNCILNSHSIENLANDESINIPYNFDYQIARNVFFKNYNKTIEKKIEIVEINKEELKKYLTDERSMNPIPVIERYTRAYDIFKLVNNI